MESIWMADAALPRFEPLEGRVKTDVLIIGGGMTGLLCAHCLQERGVDYVLAEAKTICSGITKNTTAKVTSQHGLIYHKLLKSGGPVKARLYLEANQLALKKYRELAQTIDCDFEEKPSCVYSLDNRKILEAEAEALSKIGFNPKIIPTEELPFPTVGAVCLEHQAQFHPLKFAAQIAKNLKIYEQTAVTELAPNRAETENGEIIFQKLIVATHFPMDNKHGLYYLKMYQHRSYVIALEHAGTVDGMYVDAATGGMSFRGYGDLLLVGGGGHRTGKQGGNWRELRVFAERYYPDAVEKYHWAAQDCMTLDGVAYIGEYSSKMRECFVACGFNKWGMTTSMVAAMVLADLVTGQQNPYAGLFDPARSIWKPQLICNGFEAVTSLLTPSGKRCPHMGCALKWNDAEHTWDCPCHGSRFEEDGELIDNPAAGDMKI